MKDEYSFGKCIVCEDMATLKNGKCLRCNEIDYSKDNLKGTIFEDIFNPFNNKGDV